MAGAGNREIISRIFSAGKRPAALTKISQTINKKYIRLQFFLTSGPGERTPKSSEEIRLLEAGLGKRTVCVADNSCHNEIVSQLEGHYPKLKQLSGGWLCYKASGGHGQRKLTVVATEDEGYNAQLLKNVSNNGRHILYILPLQEDIDSTPLPHDSQEFAKMPKSSCKKCGIMMPLQFLALHIKDCEAEVISDDSEIDSIHGKDAIATETCPICGQDVPREDIEYHASSCGDGFSYPYTFLIFHQCDVLMIAITYEVLMVYLKMFRFSSDIMPFLDNDAGDGNSGTTGVMQPGSSRSEQSTSGFNEMAGPSTAVACHSAPGASQNHF